jgi:hypothetical protein
MHYYDIYVASIVLPLLLTLLIRSILLRPFMLMIDPPTNGRRNLVTFTEEKRRKRNATS